MGITVCIKTDDQEGEQQIEVCEDAFVYRTQLNKNGTHTNTFFKDWVDLEEKEKGELLTWLKQMRSLLGGCPF